VAGCELVGFGHDAADVEEGSVGVEDAGGETGRGHRRMGDAAPILAHAERVLHDAGRALAEVASIRAGGSGRVRVGTMSVAAASLVPEVVLRLRARAPGIEVSLVEDIAVQLWGRFERHELDVLVTRLDARALGSGQPHRRLFADRHRVVCG